MNWTLEDILSHPAMELSLKQLLRERIMALKHNARVSSPKYKFKGLTGVKIASIESIDKFIRLKQDSQLKINFDE